MFEPIYRITSAISKSLMRIEASRQAIIELPINIAMLASLRETARLLATHYSTQIEGNLLTQAQVTEAISGAHFPGRERDEKEVRNYYSALAEVEALVLDISEITELNIRRLHGLVMEGRGTPTGYRTGQNVIRDSKSGGIVYMPPEAGDVPVLMSDLTRWIATETEANELPAPILAALAHYQFATIHPYYDGNGRTARLLTSLILHKVGYGLKGIYSLEEYYAQNLEAYYEALSIGPSHNYYMGRVEADATPFVAYFSAGMADAFDAVKAQAMRSAGRGATDQSRLLRELAPRERKLLILFHAQAIATTADIAQHLNLSPRTVVSLSRRWLDEGFLQLRDASRKNRSYSLGADYESLI